MSCSKRRSALVTVAAALIFGAIANPHVRAQAGGAQASPQRGGTREGQSSPPAPATAKPAPEPAAEQQIRRGLSMNIKIELVLTDSAPGKVITEERFVTLLADRQLGRVRRRHIPTPAAGIPSGALSVFEVDVTPTIIGPSSGAPAGGPGSKIQFTMTMSYSAPGGALGDDSKESVTFTENVVSFLETGKTTTIIDTKADPKSNRSVVVEATATIQN